MAAPGGGAGRSLGTMRSMRVRPGSPPPPPPFSPLAVARRRPPCPYRPGISKETRPGESTIASDSSDPAAPARRHRIQLTLRGSGRNMAPRQPLYLQRGAARDPLASGSIRDGIPRPRPPHPPQPSQAAIHTSGRSRSREPGSDAAVRQRSRIPPRALTAPRRAAFPRPQPPPAECPSVKAPRRVGEEKSKAGEKGGALRSAGPC